MSHKASRKVEGRPEAGRLLCSLIILLTIVQSAQIVLAVPDNPKEKSPLSDQTQAPAPAAPVRARSSPRQEGVARTRPSGTDEIAAEGGDYHTVTPCRLLDTRGSPPQIGTIPRALTVKDNCGVPSDAAAITGNLTAVAPAAAGFLRVYAPCTSPDTSTLNYNLGVTRGNNFISSILPDRQLNLWSTVPVDATVDVTGYFTAPSTFCGSTCMAHGHFTRSEARFPFTEDISSAHLTSTPCKNPVKIYGPTTEWTTIQAGCQELNLQNLQGSEAFNVLLRTQIDIGVESTAGIGARYEVRLLVDGQERGWYLRRLRSPLPQTDRFQGSAQNLTAGNHAYSLQARLLDPGMLVFHQQWLTAQGAPTHYPAGKAVSSGALPIGSAFVPVTDTVYFTTPEAESPTYAAGIDIMLDGYVQVTSVENPTAKLEFGFSLDGQPAARTSSMAVPANLYDSVSPVDHVLNVGGVGQVHSLRLLARVTAGTAVLEHRQLEYTSFPVFTPPFTAVAGEVQATNIVRVDTNTQEAQPANLDTEYGKWTKVLEMTLPSSLDGVGTIEGYVQLKGNLVGSSLANASFHVNSFGGVDAGINGFQATPTEDGIYIFGEAGSGCAPCIASLWIRKYYKPGVIGSPGGFDVGYRYMGWKWLPSEGCLY